MIGETGTGKTTLVQRLASLSGQDLIVQNMSLQTDSSDLLGGYRPLEVKQVARPLYLEFVDLFTAQFSKDSNKKFLDYINNAFEREQWKKFSHALRKGIKMLINKVCFCVDCLTYLDMCHINFFLYSLKFLPL